ncbi:terminase large subunit domain-containing protein [Gibbsiella dentisursi]
MNTHDDLRTQAKRLYWLGRDMGRIAEMLNVSRNTLYTWRRRDKWDEARPVARAHDRTLQRYLLLADREPDEIRPRDFKLMDFYARQLARFERATQRDEDREEKRKPRQPKNHFSQEQEEALRVQIMGALFEHQKRWYRAREHRNRMILKSRQIGATWYFAHEALLDALETGRNQIFLSASRSQAFQFKRAIQKTARQVGVDLKGGNEIVLANGAILYFLGTSAATAQSYNGNFYFDEIFWSANFLKLREVAAGMASHTGLRRTYFSTASSEDHQAYQFWNGQYANEGRKKSEHIDIDISHDSLKNGRVCEDGMWRQMVTVEDAINLGCDLIKLDEIKGENSPDAFNNLYMCVFVAPGERAFDYNALMGCGVDGFDEWGDWRDWAARPLGDLPVWLGYDPNGTSGQGDSAGLSVVAPPRVPGGRFRVVETLQIRTTEFEAQAEVIRQATQRYNVQFIGIDGTGVGESVYKMVMKFFPAARLYQYNPALKREMVLKAQLLIRQGRLEYDAGNLALVSSLMTVKKFVTPGGVVSYDSDRARGSNHGDIAWATMQALYNEPIGAETTGNTGFVMEY